MDNVHRLRELSRLEEILGNRTGYYLILSEVCQCLPIGDIISLSRTSKALSHIYQSLLQTQFQIDPQLRRFFDDPTAFRSRLAKHNALISGSFALQFFERAVWTDSDLDLFFEYSEAVVEDFMAFLTDTEKYDYTGMSLVHSEVEYPIKGLVAIYRFKKQPTDKYPWTRRIELITTEGAPLNHIIGRFYATVVINVISWNCAYSIFPLITHVYRKAVKLNAFLSDGPWKGTEGIEKYAKRGWTAQNRTSPEDEKVKKYPVRAKRCVGDQFTWKIAFNTDRVAAPPIADSTIEQVEFCMTTAGGSYVQVYMGSEIPRLESSHMDVD
ncbi:hypothetical protein MMC25_003359 [Agyrium rufum]|nr:hypothetical protein [Agyrium rufum]